MTESADRSQRQPPRAPPVGRGLSGTVRDELAKLRGRNIGACAKCDKPVYFEHNFMRFRGRVVHVRCPIGAGASAPLPLSVDGVVAHHLTPPNE